jgi:ubiquitin-protein ligase
MHESPRIRRLRNDLTALERLRSESTVFEFQATGNPPTHYLINFKGKGLCRDRGKVKIAHYHRVEVKLGASYPRTIPELRWLTPIYHPNISEIGMVCLGGYGTHWVPSVQLDELCIMLWDMARYFNYDIRSPYNRDAALWVANQTSILFPTDSRPLRDVRVAQGRVEDSKPQPNGKSKGLTGNSSGRSPRAGWPFRNESGTERDSRSAVSRVRLFMERYARAIGDGLAQQPELSATLVAPEPLATAVPEPTEHPVGASAVTPNGEQEPGNVVLNTLIGPPNGHPGADEQDGVVILEATSDAPVRPARRSDADDEIVFLE